MTGYNKWQARAELLRHTAATSIRAVPRALRQSSSPGPGINFLTYSPGSGLSMADLGDLLGLGLEATGLPVANHFMTTKSGGHHGRDEVSRLFPATVALVQSGHIPTAALQYPRLFTGWRFITSVVHYELPEVPGPQRLGVPFLDEIWTTSRFVQESFGSFTKKPVRVLPVPIVPAPSVPGRMRHYLGLGEEYLFGYQFDLASSGERKNPQGVARAYLAAFPAVSDDVRLLLKAAHAASAPEVWANLQRLVEGRRDILLVDEYWPREVVETFFEDIDCYVSLHRAEGFGLTIAKAMAAGKPVIATAYSGNTDLMSADNSVGVPYRLVKVGPNPVYPSEGTWADPDIDLAADAMRDMEAHRGTGRRMGRRGRELVLADRTPERTGAWLREHLPLT